jgi:hypothetical protein
MTMFRWLKNLVRLPNRRARRARRGHDRRHIPLGVRQLGERVVPTVYYWIGPAGGDWTAMSSGKSDWSLTSGGLACGAYPNGAGDTANFDNNSPGNCNLQSNVTVSSLSISSWQSLNISAATLTITEASSSSWNGTNNNDDTAGGGRGEIDLCCGATLVLGTAVQPLGINWTNGTLTSSDGTGTLQIKGGQLLLNPSAPGWHDNSQAAWVTYAVPPAGIFTNDPLGSGGDVICVKSFTNGGESDFKGTGCKFYVGTET